MTTIINVKCLDQSLQITNKPTISSGGIKENKVKFDFCELWNGFAKVAVFYKDKNNVYNVVVDNDECYIPSEVLSDEGYFYFGVYGVLNNVRRTSDILKYDVVEGAFIAGNEPEDPTPDIYNQIIQLNQEAIESARSLMQEGFKNQNGGNLIRLWVGTKEEYDAITEQDGVIYVVHDEPLVADVALYADEDEEKGTIEDRLSPLEKIKHLDLGYSEYAMPDSNKINLGSPRGYYLLEAFDNILALYFPLGIFHDDRNSDKIFRFEIDGTKYVAWLDKNGNLGAYLDDGSICSNIANSVSLSEAFNIRFRYKRLA